MKLKNIVAEFLKSEKTAGVLLILSTLISIVLINSAFGNKYAQIWNFKIFDESIVHWINDGLMAIFFLLIGLELEREIYIGELSNIKTAMLPLIAATGGILVPAAIFLCLNYGTATQNGVGIPVATDIAFALAVLTLLGNRVPLSLKIFLTALAVIDDLGAIIVIAVFYTKTLIWLNLIIVASVFLLLLLLNRLRIHYLPLYLVGGCIMWYFMLKSGVHSSITGILLAFAIPFDKGSHRSPSSVMQHYLHKPVAFLILPLFALANTCIVIHAISIADFLKHSSIGIIAGLTIGKPIGISLFSYMAVKIGLCTLPSNTEWKHIIGIGLLGGIGFTMSIFITHLAYSDELLINTSKLMILCASFIAALIGFVWLNYFLKPLRK